VFLSLEHTDVRSSYDSNSRSTQNSMCTVQFLHMSLHTSVQISEETTSHFSRQPIFSMYRLVSVGVSVADVYIRHMLSLNGSPSPLNSCARTVHMDNFDVLSTYMRGSAWM
jgi:hypothetical protein